MFAENLERIEILYIFASDFRILKYKSMKRRTPISHFGNYCLDVLHSCSSICSYCAK